MKSVILTPRVRAPKGFFFKIRRYEFGNKDWLITLYDSINPSNYIGSIQLERLSDNKYITHSSLNEAYRGKGLGTLMYAKAIQFCMDKGFKVSSSNSPSYYAQRVWESKSIRKFFLIKKRRSDKYGNYSWFAYNKLNMNKENNNVKTRR